MLTTKEVTACLVTRGDQPEMMERILDSLVFDHVVIYDNSQRDGDMKTAGRFQAMTEARTEVVYFQDDDVIVPRSTQYALMEAYEPGIPTCVYGHGETPAGYDDLPLYCGGALVDQATALTAWSRWVAEYGQEEDFLYYCDFAIGVLYPVFKHVRFPFEIVMEVAQHESRLCNQPFAAGMKADVTARARAIRDRRAVAA